ncbi:MAG: hypothetical protein Q9227_009473 [Pyrenula ochraceoflavens]
MALKRRKQERCSSASRVSAKLLLSFLAFSNPAAARQRATPLSPAQVALPPLTPEVTDPSLGRNHEFTLRHIFHHGTYQDPKLHKRVDVTAETSLWTEQDDGLREASLPTRYSAQSRNAPIQRLSDRRLENIESYLSIGRRRGFGVTLDASAWTTDQISSPNVTDKDTVISIARMAANAYVQTPGEGEWEDANHGFNYSQSFGWENDGLRGHIFADEGNSTIVIGLKGTTPAVFDGDQTTTNDKVNDNLFFSCCCGKGGQYFWKQVCDCYDSTYTCNKTCLVKALKQENRYYRAAIELYTNVTALYPDSQIWLTGHSLGGAVTSLLGMTFGLPVITFEAPGEALAASRLGLPAPPEIDPSRPQTRELTGAYHFGHTADPIFMGTCNGATAACTLGGYAMETQCHTGLECVYDTVGDKGWRSGIGNHKVHNVIDNVIIPDDLPECKPDTECVDCFNWKYFESNGTQTTTSSSSSTSTSATRTTTCQTPGWWGCRDPTTTSDTTTTTSTSSTSTSTCKTPGWFGCNDPTTTTVTTTTTTSPTPTQTSASVTSTTASQTAYPAPTSTSSPPSTTSRATTTATCHTPGWFGCKDKTDLITKTSTITKSPAKSSSSTPEPSHKDRCKRRVFFGLICAEGEQQWRTGL